MKKKKPKYNNEYKLRNDIADDILKLNNKEIISRASREYANWIANEKIKKEDTALQAVLSAIKDIKEIIKEDGPIAELEDKLKEMKEAASPENLATLEEEKKNLMGPYNEDTKLYKSSFQLSMDEINRRKLNGLLEVQGKIV